MQLTMSYRILKITSFYKSFLKYFYNKYPDVISLPYPEHYNAIMYQGHGWSDFFQKHFSEMGVEAYEIVHNANYLQQSWAEANNTSLDNILLSQIKTINPDVLFFQDCISFTPDFFTSIRNTIPNVKLMLGHCCSPFSRHNLEAFSKLDFMLSCSPGFSEIFNRHGIKNYNFLHAFESEILNRITIPIKRKNQVVFTGSFLKVSDSQFHDERLKIVERIINDNIPLELFATIERDTNTSILLKQIAYFTAVGFKNIGLNNLNNSIDVLKKSSFQNKMPRKSNYSKPFLKAINSPVYGLDMFQSTANSTIAFNNHGGISGDYAANMRMFEVAGVGTLLLTDYKKNIDTIFVPDYEIVTYKNSEECISKMKWLVNNPEEAQKIALAGQKRVLKDHSIKNRVELIDEIIRENLINK